MGELDTLYEYEVDDFKKRDAMLNALSSVSYDSDLDEPITT
jgi:hypothetical protein